MFIDKLTLFIVGEVLLVIVVISTYLLYKSRLYRVLLALLVEMRKERARREMEKRKQLAELREQNKKLVAQIKKQNEPSNGIDTLIEQVDEQMKSMGLEESATFDPESSAKEQLLTLRKAFLSLEDSIKNEGELTDPGSQQLLKQFESLLDIKREPQGEDQSTMVDDLHNQLAEKQDQISSLEDKLEKLTTIDTEEIANIVPPEKGEFADEIYRLKCDKFDMMETINRLRLELQGSDDDLSPDQIIEKQNEQITEQNRYMKESDVVISLLEQELETANANIAELEKKLKENTNKKTAEVMERPTAVQEPNQKIDQLTNVNNAQQDSVAILRDQLNQLRDAEDKEELIHKQEEEINKLENNIREAETCVTLMETELNTAFDSIDQLEHELKELKANPPEQESSTQDKEMEDLLRKFINDSQEMLSSINELEEENLDLKSQLGKEQE